MSKEIQYDEQQLLVQIAEGDTRAFQKIYDEYRNQIYSFSFKFLHREELAQELVQDVFTKIWLVRTSLAGVQNIGGFLYTVARNMALSRLRRMATEQQAYHQIGKSMSESNLTDDDVLHRDYQKLLKQVIETLPTQQKAVYLMSREQGMSRQEIAEALNISPNTVKAHLSAATDTLRTWFNRHKGEMLALFMVLHASR